MFSVAAHGTGTHRYERLLWLTNMETKNAEQLLRRIPIFSYISQIRESRIGKQEDC